MQIISKDPLLEKKENEPLRKLINQKFKNRIEI